MAKTFVIMLGRRYRVYFNPQTKYWFADYMEAGKRTRVSLGVETKPEAEHAVKRMDESHFLVAQEAPAVVNLTWREFQEKYLEYKTNLGKSPNTVARFKSALNAFSRHLKKQGVTYVNQVTLSILDGYGPYRTKVEKCDPKTAYTDSLTIKNAFKWGSKASRGYVKVNPALDWETPEPISPKRRMYTLAEVEKLEQEVRPWLRPIITTLAYTGMRVGE